MLVPLKPKYTSNEQLNDIFLFAGEWGGGRARDAPRIFFALKKKNLRFKEHEQEAGRNDLRQLAPGLSTRRVDEDGGPH